jgi:putative transposase
VARFVGIRTRTTDRQREGPVQCRERLGGLLRYYHREAA